MLWFRRDAPWPICCGRPCSTPTRCCECPRRRAWEGETQHGKRPGQALAGCPSRPLPRVGRPRPSPRSPARARRALRVELCRLIPLGHSDPPSLGLLDRTPETYHVASLRAERHLKFHETRDNLEFSDRSAWPLPILKARLINDPGTPTRRTPHPCATPKSQEIRVGG